MMVLEVPVKPLPTYPHKSTPLSPRLTKGSPKLHSKTLIKDSTSPASPTFDNDPAHKLSLLSAADDFAEVIPGVRSITAQQLSDSLERASKVPLPDSNTVFPWLHGLDPANEAQLRHFDISNPTEIRCPTTYRGITLVHSSSLTSTDLAGLVGSLSEADLLELNLCGDTSKIVYRQIDPVQNIGLRNFRIQSVKIAMLSDIVVHGVNEDGRPSEAALDVAREVAQAQQNFRLKQKSPFPQYSTFLLHDSLQTLRSLQPQLFISQHGLYRSICEGEFFELEREQMQQFTQATEIAHNVFLGNNMDWKQNNKGRFDIHVSCDDASTTLHFPEDLASLLVPGHSVRINFPSSGSLESLSETALTHLIAHCAWIYRQANPSGDHVTQWWNKAFNCSMPEFPSDESCEHDKNARKVLVSCEDGYTETSLFALAYLIYAECLTLDEAWVFLHKDKNRDFYAYKEDVSLLEDIAPALQKASPVSEQRRSATLSKAVSPWLRTRGVLADKSRGCLPSRIMDHLYLGNIDHANNIDMLLALGIPRVLSVGERPSWSTKLLFAKQETRLTSLCIGGMVDNGISSITPHIERCLEFIDQGLTQGQKTLVHCQVGVSRSATICIAEVIRRRQSSLQDAYLFVRARRLNVIIQPNLRFMYELLCWTQEEETRRRAPPVDTTGLLTPRTIEWPHLARQISRLNQLYAAQG